MTQETGEGQQSPEPTPELTPGTPEYNEAMIARAKGTKPGEGDEAEGTGDNDFQAQDAEGKWVGKFNSPEEMAKAYKELESKLGQPKEDEQQEEETPNADLPDREGEGEGDTEEDGEGEGDDAEKTPSVTQEFFDEMGSKFQANEGFSDEDYGEFEKRGVPRTMVELAELGIRSQNADRVSAAEEACGGKEEFEAVRTWAGQELDDASYKAFQKQLNEARTPQDVAVVYETLATRRKAASGEAELVNGDGGSPSAPGYGSRKEMTTDMSDPKYASDSAFRAKVQRRIANTKWLNKRQR